MNDKEIKVDIMRYKKNSLSFLLCILAIVLDVIMFLIIYKKTSCIPNYQLGIDLIINVIFMLACFLIAEKQKAYIKSSSIAGFVVAGLELARIFWIPLYYFNQYKEYLETAESTSTTLVNGLPTNGFVWCVILIVGAAACLVIASIINMIKSAELEAHIKNQEQAGDK